MVETLVCVADLAAGCMPLSMGDAAWLVVTTMMTIGYGDQVAHTVGASGCCFYQRQAPLTQRTLRAP